MAAGVALALALAACGREAPLEERVGQRLANQDHDGALAVLDQRLRREPGDQAARVLRVRVLLRAGRMDQAIEAYAALPEGVVDQEAELARELVLALVRDALRQHDAYLQSRGALALAAIGDVGALPLFREALAHPNPSVRAATVRGLPRLQSPEGAALAEGALADGDGGVRAVAAEALGVMGAEGARGPLRRALQDREGGVRMRAAVALALLGDAEARGLLRRAVLAAGGGVTSAGNHTDRPGSGVDRVLVMNNPAEREYVQIVAAEALARLGEPQGLAVLVRMLSHRRRFVALFAAESLSNLGDPAPRPFLLGVMKDPGDRAHRLYAAWTLARLGDGAGGPAVAEFLTHPDEHLRQRAAWTLGQMGRLAPIAPLRRALADPNRGVRYQAAWALGEIMLVGAPPPPAEGG